MKDIFEAFDFFFFWIAWGEAKAHSHKKKKPSKKTGQKLRVCRRTRSQFCICQSSDKNSLIWTKSRMSALWFFCQRDNVQSVLWWSETNLHFVKIVFPPLELLNSMLNVRLFLTRLQRPIGVTFNEAHSRRTLCPPPPEASLYFNSISTLHNLALPFSICRTWRRWRPRPSPPIGRRWASTPTSTWEPSAPPSVASPTSSRRSSDGCTGKVVDSSLCNPIE